MRQTLKALAVILLCLLAVAAAFSAGFAAHMVLAESRTASSTPGQQIVLLDPTQPDEEEAGAFAIFWEAWHLVKQHFLGDLPAPQQVAYGALKGALQELRDPYTTFVEPASRELERDEHRGRFGGIGVWLYQRETDRRFVLKPHPDGPAASAGVQEDDVLVQVDDVVLTETMTIDQVAALVRGPIGTPVRIVVERDGRRLSFTITRQEYQTPSVEWRMLDDQAPHAGYLRITMFTERTGAEVQSALQEMRARGMEYLVLDLRDNPGGLLESALDVASQFLRDGVLMYEVRRGGEEKSYPVRQGGTAGDIPMVVLVNGGTASAAEIVAGALHDHQRALLVGEKTFGKGSVQLVFDLSDGSSIHITVARWLRPSRLPIDGTGIEPDHRVSLTEEQRQQGVDALLNAGIAALMAQTP